MTQLSRVKAVLEGASRPLALHDLRRIILNRFGVSDAETAISARIRELRPRIAAEGKTILSDRAGPGKAHNVYWIASLR